ncbi:MAG: Ig-like domain-containing protein, partial [Gammaproteobacteria bacterium]
MASLTYRFAVTAFNTAGVESDYSAEIAHTVTNVVTPNIPPTLASLASMTVLEDAGAHTVLLTGITSGGENQTLTVTASSTPPSLIPSIEVLYTSPRTTGTLSFVTGPNLSGTGVVNVTVSDGLAQTVRSFAVTVNPANDAPTLVSIPNQTTAEDTATAAIPFTVGDVDTAVASLTLSCTSSDLALVPNANVVFGGSGANRTVRVTPVANQFGTTTISVSVSDGALSASRTFQLTVTSSNDPPTIASLPAATVPLNILTVLQPVVIADIDTAASSLVVTGTSSDTNVLPNANIVLGTLGLSRTLSVRPLTAGAATVTLRVSDGVAQATQSFLLTVTNVVTPNLPPTLASIPNQTIAEDTATPAISLTVADVDTAVASLTLSG